MQGRDEQGLDQLLQAAIAGDERAYGEFLRRTAVLVRRFAQRRIDQGGMDPEDIVQDTLLAIHSKRHTWHVGAPVQPWIYAIARYKLADAFRRRGRSAEVDVADMAESLAQPEANTLSEREIGRALDTLPSAQRSVISAISLQGHSVGEAAKNLGISEGAVRVAFHRGLTSIARRFRSE